jgi:YVTN family beta-propeller protein
MNFVRRFCVSVTFMAVGPGLSGYHLLDKISIPKPGSWDYITVDAVGRRVYLSHETEVDVMDADSHKVIGVIADTPGVHGIAIASEFGRGFITAGTSNQIAIFDLKTFRVLGRVTVQKKPDCIVYDPFTKRIFVMNGNSNSTTVINPKDATTEATIDLGGGPEFSVADGKGEIYVNLKEQNELIGIDSRALKVVDRWSTLPCKEPASLALDSLHHRLFLGCRSKLMAVVNTDNGKVVASYPVGDHVDATVFDPSTGLVFNSTGEGNVAVFKQKSADEYSLVEKIETNPGSKTMGLDSRTHQIFIPESLSGVFTVVIYGL